VEQHHAQRVARKLRADQGGERERDFLGRGEAVLAVQDMECEQSSISTVADDERYSAWCTIGRRTRG